MATVEFSTSPPLSFSLGFIGSRSLLNNPTILTQIQQITQPLNVSPSLFTSAIKKLSPGEYEGASISLCAQTQNSEDLYHITFGATSSVASRHNNPARPDQIPSLVKQVFCESQSTIYLAVSNADEAFALGCAAVRAFPLYTQKNLSSPKVQRTVYISFLSPDAALKIDLDRIKSAAKAIRWAARLVDTPTSEMYTTDMIGEALKGIKGLPGAKMEVIQGLELKERGFGGLWGVGKAATNLPALVILSYEPENFTKKICLVGKGIVFDTGGLNIKVATMPGMKRDMGGAAAVLSSFVALVECKTKYAVYALLCLAENSIGPDSYRPDDILYMYSGKTVEVNNTDAEGRLVLADGVSYATKHIKPDILLDMATLTGGQAVSTGIHHSAIVANHEEIETKAFKSGLTSGDLVYPLVFTPELHMTMFSSAVADMKNSVKDRANAISSCAACFIYKHIDPSWNGQWLHVDIARPAYSGERATGVGVALIMELFKN